MIPTPYRLSRAFGRFIKLCCMRMVVLHRERMDLPGGYILACSHISHVEPALITAMANRHISWMTRIEFYKYRAIGRLLDAGGCFSVDRYGVPVRSIRTAIERAQAGRVVGIFPEGGVARGVASMMRGGPMKRGVCVVSYRAAVPVVPVVVLGTEKLTRPGPWMPFKWGKLWVICGKPVQPHLNEPRRRVARELMARDLQAAFVSLYQELCSTCGIDPATGAGA
jgi:1-acyl-sn-glycerol-3-phosphate acyltransferase